MRAKERERPWFSFDDDDDDPREQSFFGTKPTEEELAERKAKREAAVSSRLQAIAHFELEIEALAEKQTGELKKLVSELEDFMNMSIAACREDNAELLDKKRGKLLAMQEQRMQEAAAGTYGKLVWDVVMQRVAESEIFVACLTPEYLCKNVCACIFGIKKEEGRVGGIHGRKGGWVYVCRSRTSKRQLGYISDQSCERDGSRRESATRV